MCNQACHHCHVEAGPKRTESMNRIVAERVAHLLKHSPGVHTLDLTGGAPELNPNFRWLVEQARELGCDVIDRCNLTVLQEPGQGDLANFLAANEVHVVASLPCYGPDNVDAQRGKGVFERSIRALSDLNRLGYGRSRGRLRLDLVYNPLGATLPPAQLELEMDYKRRLKSDYDVDFDRLLTLTNVPIKRFADQLMRRGELDAYFALLANSFNPNTLDGLMCRYLVSVAYVGKLHVCDFNQMLVIPSGTVSRTVFDIDALWELENQPVAVGQHCFACTAGAGSSCS
ncbi:MAG: arsenosugar biosynthesis radical SAM (seleno)protein ArsS, partial [Polyangiaceae bacterium]